MIKLFDGSTMAPLFCFLERCKLVKQLEVHHPEGNVLNHSLQVLQQAFRETTDIDLILAAMLHDIGKAENSKGHERIAIEWLEPYVSLKTLWLIEHHMRVWDFLLGNMKRKSKVEYLYNHCWLPELILLARLDKMGRQPNKKMEFTDTTKESIVDRLNKCVEARYQ